MDKLASMQVFVRVVDAGTFTRAAELLKLPKSSVTRLVQTLEKEVGVKLLHRTTRRLRVTPEGALYYDGAVRLLEQVGQLDASVADANRAPRGKIKVEAPAAVVYNILLPAMGDFLARYPEVELELGVGNRVIDLIAESVDCVVRLGPLHNDALIARPLGTLRMVTCASPAYVDKHGLPRDPAELAQRHTLIRIVAPRSGRAFTDELTRGGELTTLTGRAQIAVNDSTAALVACLSGLGVATTYAFLVEQHLASGALRRVLPDWQGELVQAHVAYAENRHLALKVRVFVDWVTEVFKTLRAG